MARNVIASTAAPGSAVTALTALPWEAADTVNQNTLLLTGKEILLIWNSGASTRTFTITSATDRYGRTGTIGPTNILAGEFFMIGPFDASSNAGWKQTGGATGSEVFFEANHAEVKFAVIQVP